MVTASRSLGACDGASVPASFFFCLFVMLAPLPCFRTRSSPRTDAHASKRSRQQAAGVTACTAVSDSSDGDERLPDLPLSQPGALVLRHNAAHTSKRSRSARRKALKRARRRQLLDACTPRAFPVAAPPSIVTSPPEGVAMHAAAQDAAKSGYV